MEEKKKEDIAFYEDQKHDRVLSMIGKDGQLHGQHVTAWTNATATNTPTAQYCRSLHL